MYQLLLFKLVLFIVLTLRENFALAFHTDTYLPAMVTIKPKLANQATGYRYAQCSSVTTITIFLDCNITIGVGKLFYIVILYYYGVYFFTITVTLHKIIICTNACHLIPTD